LSKKQSKSPTFDELLNQYLDLEDDPDGNSKNYQKMYRLIPKMIKAAIKYDDAHEVLDIIGKRSKYFSEVFSRAHSLAHGFDDTDSILDCCDMGSEYYYPILQDLRQMASNLEEWMTVDGRLEKLLQYYRDHPDKYMANDSLIDELMNQLEEAFQHIMDLTQTVEDCDDVITWLSDGSEEIEDIIQKRDTLRDQSK
jgi:hypothetical protein